MRKRARPCFGTIVRLTMRGIRGMAAADAALSGAFKLAEKFHRAMSWQDEGSDVSAIGRLRPGEWLELHAETFDVLRLALDIAEDSDGVFDPVVPAAHGREAGWRDLILRAGRVAVRQELQVSLDGIAKGYAADCLCGALKDAGAEDVVVDAGGDLALDCSLPKRVGIRKPDRPSHVARTLLLAKGGVASSGNYGGISELWSPARARGEWPMAVTVVAPSCAIADAMTKVAAIEPHAPVLSRWSARALPVQQEAA